MNRSFLVICALLLSFTVSAKKFKLNTTIVSTDGCEWKLVGYVDIGFSGVNGYDVTISGPCGEHHFVGAAAPSGGNGNNGNHTPNVHAYRYRSQKLTPTTTPFNKLDKEKIHQHIFRCCTENIDVFPVDE